MVEKEELLKNYYHYLHYYHYISATRKSQNHTETLQCSHNLGGQVELKGESRILCSRLRVYKQDLNKFSPLFEESANKGHLSGLPIPDKAS